MKSYSLQQIGQIWSAKGIQILKPQKEEVKDYLSTFPSHMQKQAEQIRDEVLKHGYQAYKFLSFCKYGFVISAKKGRVRYAIKVKQNIVLQQEGYIDLVEKHRLYPENLRFMNHPNILSLVESFESKDYHYTVTEECMCNLKEFVSLMKIQMGEQSLAFQLYADQLMQGIAYLGLGPSHINSDRFISHVEPRDVLVSYSTKLKINPSFGDSNIPIGYYPFYHTFLTIKGKIMSATERLSKSYASLLLYILGMSEKNIMRSEYDSQPYCKRSTPEYETMYSILNNSRERDRLENIQEIYGPRQQSEFEELIGFQLQLDKLEDRFLKENEGGDIFAVGKGQYCISLEQYTQLYQISNEKLSSEKSEEINEFIEDESKRLYKKLKRIKFVHDLLRIDFAKEFRSQFRSIINESKYQLRKISRRIINVSIDLNDKRKELLEKKKEKLEEEQQEELDKKEEIEMKQLKTNI